MILKVVKQHIGPKVLSKLYIMSIATDRTLETKVPSKDIDETKCELNLDGTRAIIEYNGEQLDTGYDSKYVYRYFSLR